MCDPSELVRLLDRALAGDPNADAELMPHVYADLRQMAAKYLRRERRDHTLQATALVHEAYLRLVGRKEAGGWRGRTHFFATSAQVMRRILTDHARQTKAVKRGAGLPELELDDALLIGGQDCRMIADLDEALTRLGEFAPRQARVVEMRFFGGMSEEEIAQELDVSTRTVKRDWNVAKAWLYGELVP